MYIVRFPRLRAAAVAALVIPAALPAQISALLDEGTFNVTRNGVPVGRESFRFIRSPSATGQYYQASGYTSVDSITKRVVLGTDSAGVPVSYKAQVRVKGEPMELEGRGRMGRFSVVSRTRASESAREYLLENGALLMDENVFHHFYFVVK